MSNIEIIEERPLSLNDLKVKLEKVKKRDNNLNFRGNKTENYLNSLTKSQSKKPEELENELNTLGLGRLRERQIKKITDIKPIDLDSLRTIISGENLTLKTEDLQKIVEIVKKYV